MEIKNNELHHKINTLGITNGAAMASFLLSNLAYARLVSHLDEGKEKFSYQLDLSKTFGIQSIEHDNDNYRLFADASLLLNNAFTTSEKRVKLAIEGHFATLEVVGNKFSPDDLSQVMQYLNAVTAWSQEPEQVERGRAAMQLAFKKIRDIDLS